ncbi:MAG TPA: IS1595 family transposase [Candidatus Saccharimonadales bacterium]|nr:IS1595 family transposase [Candidatus Saccharimonadales bacterium]
MKTQFKNLPEILDYFKDENTCRELLELQRWNGKPFCPHCGHEKVYRTNRGFKCAEPKCYKKFSVTVGTIFENSKIPLRIWFASIYLHTAHKKGISSHQLGRDLGISQKTAWFVLQRVRAMLKEKAPAMLEGTVEVDETFVGGKAKNKHAKQRREIKATGYVNKTMVFGILDRDGKKVHNQIVANVDGNNLKPIIYQKVKEGAIVMSDGFGAYSGLNKTYQHEVINHHQGEYFRDGYHTNTLEGYWSQLKRGIYGIYHSTSRKHLHRYCDEFAYRYNTRNISDQERFISVLTKVADARLTWNQLTK